MTDQSSGSSSRGRRRTSRRTDEPAEQRFVEDEHCRDDDFDAGVDDITQPWESRESRGEAAPSAQDDAPDYAARPESPNGDPERGDFKRSSYHRGSANRDGANRGSADRDDSNRDSADGTVGDAGGADLGD